MNASRACPFLGQEIQRLVTKDPIHPTTQQALRRGYHKAPELSSGHQREYTEHLGSSPVLPGSLQRWPVMFILQSFAEPFLRFPTSAE